MMHRGADRRTDATAPPRHPLQQLDERLQVLLILVRDLLESAQVRERIVAQVAEGAGAERLIQHAVGREKSR